MPLAADQVRLMRNGFTLLMGPGTPYTVMPGWDPWSRTVRADQGGPRPYSHGSWAGSEWMDEAVVLIPVSVYRSRSTKAEWMAAHQELARAFAAVGSSGEMCELAFEWGGREYLLFGRPRQVRVSTDNVSVGKSFTQCAFVAADPRIYSAELLTVSTGLPLQQGGLTIPARVASTRLRLPGTSGSYASTPDHASIDITGDIDVRFEGDIDWIGSQRGLVSKGFFTATDRSYLLSIETSGALRLWWSATGSATTGSPVSTVPVPISSGHLAVRATLDVDNGAGGRTVTYYTGPSKAGPWTALGAPVPQAGVTSVFVGASVLEVGSWGTGAAGVLGGSVTAAEVRSGIGGTVVADPDFTAQTFGATSFSDSTGKTWTVHGGAKLVGGTYRGGVTLPATIPGVLAGGKLELVNSGTTDSGMTVRISGPAVEPRLILQRPDGTVQSIRFTIDLAEGQWLDIDSTRHLALLNGLPESNQRGNAVWDLDPYPLQPGGNTLRFLSGVYDANSQLTVSHRSAWW